MKAIVDATADEIDAVIGEGPLPAWRHRQLSAALWRASAHDWDDVLEWPAAWRERLRDSTPWTSVVAETISLHDDAHTIKVLGRLSDGQAIETVVMEQDATATSRRRGTICVSSQVGCAVGCPFCATGRAGLRRSCTPAEVADQVRLGAGLLAQHGFGPVTNVVYMGMGEPLAAVPTTLGSIRLMVEGGGLSARRITVSTSGIVPGIEALAQAGFPVRLALSLHAANDGLRDTLVPVNKTFPLERVLGAATAYAASSSRRLTFEWCLIGGVNDSEEDAAQLVELARSSNAHVNVIPMNRIDGSPWGPPSHSREQRFMDALSSINVTIRAKRGNQMDAACGQLRAALEPRRVLLPTGKLGPARPAQAGDG